MLWSEDDGPTHPGRLDLSDAGLRLTGGSKERHVLRELAIAELAEVRIGRRLDERLGGRTSVVLSLRAGGTVSVASLSAVGTLYELADRLWALVGPPPET